ncbi:hypothetical protein HYT26_02615 [Candidatus Pacearchaeota archaeon]|nr:hypothetical protein [Candidatus Pacearchaeota archaeon]
MAEQEILKEFEILETGSQFISSNFKGLQKKFGGRFIAIENKEVVANADTFDDIRRMLDVQKLNFSKIIVQFIPREGEIILY